MKSTNFFFILALFLGLANSCNQAEDKHKKHNQTQQENEPFDQTPAQPDSLQLDSLTSDSVDYNRPESPRM